MIMKNFVICRETADAISQFFKGKCKGNKWNKCSSYFIPVDLTFILYYILLGINFPHKKENNK